MPLVVGAPLLLLLFAASAFPWLLVLRARFGHVFAVPATAGGGLLLLVVVLAISHLVNASYVVALIGASVVIGALGVLVARRTPDVLRRAGRYGYALWCPALLGPLVWIGTTVASQFLPGASRFGWIMNGDALNNLYLAHAVVGGNGIDLGPSAYPVPLPPAIIAVALGSGPATSAAAALSHDLSAFELAWVVLLSAFCVAAGAVFASLIPKTQIRAVAVASALGSLLPLTWFAAGLGIQWGYFNVALVLPLLLGAWLIYLESSRNPLASLVALVGFGTLALAAWTPIAILVIALGTVVAVRHLRLLASIRGGQLAALIAVVAVGLVFFTLVSLPTLFSEGNVLAATGAGYMGFVDLWWAVPIVAVLLVAVALLVGRTTATPITWGVIALLVGAALGTALLVFEARSDGELFTAYYPKKYAWILLVFLGTLAISGLIGAFAGRVRVGLLAGVAVIALFASAILPPGSWPEVLQRQPVVRILGDYVRHDGEATVREILRLTTSEHPTVLWQSGDADEPIINEWLLLAHGGLAYGNKKLITLIGSTYFLYRTGGRYSDPGVEKLCEILPLMNGKRRVITANPNLAAQLNTACPATPAQVVIMAPLPGELPSRTGQNWQTDGIEGPLP